MNFDQLFENEKKLNEYYLFYLNKKYLKPIEKDSDLIRAHIEKAKHNLLFFDINKSLMIG